MVEPAAPPAPRKPTPAAVSSSGKTLRVYNFGGEGELAGATDVNAMSGNKLTEAQIRAKNPTGDFVQADIAEFLEKAESESAEGIQAKQIPSVALKNPGSIASNIKRVLAPGKKAVITVSTGVGGPIKAAFEEAGFTCQSHGCYYTKPN